MKARVRIHPAAADELESAADWYEQKRVGLGTDFRGSVSRVIEKIRTGGLPGSPVPHVATKRSVRRVLLTRFPYAVVFRERGSEIVILALAHQRRRPRYWRHRI